MQLREADQVIWNKMPLQWEDCKPNDYLPYEPGGIEVAPARCCFTLIHNPTAMSYLCDEHCTRGAYVVTRATEHCYRASFYPCERGNWRRFTGEKIEVFQGSSIERAYEAVQEHYIALVRRNEWAKYQAVTNPPTIPLR